MAANSVEVVNTINDDAKNSAPKGQNKTATKKKRNKTNKTKTVNFLQMADAETTITSRFGGQQIGAEPLEASLTLVDETETTKKKKKQKTL